MNDQANDQTVIASQTQVAKPQLPEVPGYKMERLLGVGGMAEVFLAEDRQLGRKAAIKMINNEGSMDADFRQRFEDEARTVASFSHPNIITVYGFGEVEGKQYIAMSFEPGGELDDKLKEGTLETAEALQICAKLAAALAYSHQRGIVHRDIKPANVLFDDAGSPVLSDFGIAKELNTSSGLTQTGMAIGSPAYMSPEQLMGQKVDGKTDVYSLGLVLFQLLHGRLPPNEMKMSQDSAARRTMVADALGSEHDDIIDILAGCFEFAPEMRPTAGELAAQLQAIQSPETSNKGKLIALALGGVLLAGIAGMSGMLIGPKTETASVSFELAPADAKLLIGGTTPSGDAIELSTGEHEAIVLAPGFQGLNQTFQVSADEPNRLSFKLAALQLPTEPNSQIPAFHAVMGRDEKPIDRDYNNIDFPIFRELLNLKADLFGSINQPLTADQKAPIVEAFQARYAVLAENGDALAQIALLLADSDGLAPLRAAERRRYKTELGAGDYPLGAFYAGFLLRSEANDAEKIDEQLIRRYKSFLEKAQAGGMSLADGFVDEANNILRANGVAP